MNFGDLFLVAYECLYFIVVFGVFVVIAVAKGRQAITNIIAALYLALLLSIEFPYYERLFAFASSPTVLAGMKLGSFLVFTIFALVLFARIMPAPFRETKLESFGKKILLSLLATVVVMVYSFTVLPVGEFLNGGTPLQILFGNEQWFFWWLIVPLGLLLFL
jgi:hypothetical protein